MRSGVCLQAGPGGGHLALATRGFRRQFALDVFRCPVGRDRFAPSGNSGGRPNVVIFALCRMVAVEEDLFIWTAGDNLQGL